MRDPDGQIHAVLTARYDKYELADAEVMRRATHQMFGIWAEAVVDGGGWRVGVDPVSLGPTATRRWRTDQNRQISGTMSTATTKYQPRSTDPSFQ